MTKLLQTVNIAQVERASFYRNYKDKEDVLLQENKRLMAKQEEVFNNESCEKPNAFFISLLDFYKEHSDFYMVLYKAGLVEMILQTLLEHLKITDNMPNALAYLKSSIAYMLYGWIVEWMKRGMKESGTELSMVIAKASVINK